MLCDWWELLSSIFLFLTQKSEGMRNGGQGVWLSLLLMIIFPWSKGMTNNPSPFYVMHLFSVTRWMHANCNLVWSWAGLVGTNDCFPRYIVCMQNMPGTLIEAYKIVSLPDNVCSLTGMIASANLFQYWVQIWDGYEQQHTCLLDLMRSHGEEQGRNNA